MNLVRLLLSYKCDFSTKNVLNYTLKLLNSLGNQFQLQSYSQKKEILKYLLQIFCEKKHFLIPFC